ncbi:MAG: hypothetical protein AAB368_09360 [bacterium]
MIRAAGSLLLLLGATTVLAELAARTGAGLLPFFLKRRLGPLERFGLGALLGLGLWGTAFLGLALASLFFRWLLFGAVLVFAAGSRAVRERRSLLVSAAAEYRSLAGPLGTGLVALMMLPAVVGLLLTERDHDSYLYHLALPWSCLESHRLLLTLISWTHFYPLPADLSFGLPLALGEERLAKGMSWVYVAGALAVFAGSCRERGWRTASWLGPVMVLPVGSLLGLLSRSKNDLPAAALFIGGALLTGRRVWTLGALLLGMCVATKPTLAVLVGPWVVFSLPPRQRILRLTALLGLPLLPWLVKSWLATGNPVYPFLSAQFASLDWDAANEAVFRNFLWNDLQRVVVPLSVLPEKWLGVMSRQYPLALLSAGGLIVLGHRRGAALACVLSQAAMLRMGVGDVGRYLLPSCWFLALAGAEGTERLPRWCRTGVIALLAATCVVQMGRLAGPTLPASMQDMALTPKAFREKWLSTYEESIGMVRAIHPRRLLVHGERLTYRLPGRALYGGQRGETLLIWKLVKESDSPRRLGARFAQLGASHMLFNFVSADWLTVRYTATPWDARMLGLYRRFAREHFVVAGHTGQCDFSNGGLYVLEIRRRALAPAPQAVWFLPGTEPLRARGLAHEHAGRYPEMLAAHLEVLKRLPDVGRAWNDVGHAYALLGDPQNTYTYLERFARGGMFDTLNIPELGDAALQLNRLDTAARALEEALQRYPDQAGAIRVKLAQVFAQLGLRAQAARQFGRAKALVEKGKAFLAGLPERSMNSTVDQLRQEALVALSRLEAELPAPREAP